MSQLENKIDSFTPFGGKARTEYQEDELAVPRTVTTAAINALDEIMFPKDDQGEWASECQTYFAVQRRSGADGGQDYFLLGGNGLLSCIDLLEDETPYSRDGADWGKCGDTLALKVYSEPPTLLTFHELTPSAVDSLRDEDGLVSDLSSEAVEKVFDDPLCTMPPILALTEVELKVDAAVIELEMERDTGESLDELAAAKTEESLLDVVEDCGERTDQSR